jgi:hypothetical protein
MPRNIDDLLDLTLTEIEKGKSIEDCLKEYPEFVPELEPLLRIALSIKGLPKPEPRSEVFEAAIIKVRHMLLTAKPSERSFSWRRLFSYQPALVRIAAVILLVILVGWSSIAISSRSVPGDLFYPVKIAQEKVQYILTFSDEGKVHRHLAFSNRRTQELAWSFKRNKRLNRRLVSAMLNEAMIALKQTALESTTVAGEFVNKIDSVTVYQKMVLNEICQCGCPDRDIIYEAISFCEERHNYLQERLNPRSFSGYTPNPSVLYKCVDWK